MTAKKTSCLVPKLRFTEFRDTEAWEQATLGTLLDRPPEYGVNAAAVPFSEDLPAYVRITDIDDDGRFAPAPRVSVDVNPSDDQFLQPGDIVFARTGASVGKSYRYRVEDGRLVFAGFLIRVRPNTDRLVPEFLSAYLSTWSYWDWVRLTSARSGQPGINGSEYASMPLPRPTDATGLPEQQKIADCLGSLDNLIAAEDRKLEALRQHKQGLMHQLFPQPGETVPRLRFPEFQDAEGWSEVPLGQIVDVASGQVDPTRPPYCDLPHVGGENIESHTGNLQGIKTARQLQLISGKYPFDEGDVLYSKIRPALNKVAAPDFKGICSADIYPIRPSNRELRREYLVYLLLSDTFLEYATKHSSRSKIPKINRDALLAYMAVIPPPIEQKRIAACFSSLTVVLGAQARIVEGLRAHKQGLLQQLFPSPEDIEP